MGTALSTPRNVLSLNNQVFWPGRKGPPAADDVTKVTMAEADEVTVVCLSRASQNGLTTERTDGRFSAHLCCCCLLTRKSLRRGLGFRCSVPVLSLPPPTASLPRVYVVACDGNKQTKRSGDAPRVFLGWWRGPRCRCVPLAAFVACPNTTTEPAREQQTCSVAM